MQNYIGCPNITITGGKSYVNGKVMDFDMANEERKLDFFA